MLIIYQTYNRPLVCTMITHNKKPCEFEWQT